MSLSLTQYPERPLDPPEPKEADEAELWQDILLEMSPACIIDELINQRGFEELCIDSMSDAANQQTPDKCEMGERWWRLIERAAEAYYQSERKYR